MTLLNLDGVLGNKKYCGRGVLIGKEADGTNALTGDLLVGRSAKSRNRVFVEEGENVVIHPFDASKVEDPSLIIYYPIRVLDNQLIVTNGDQTDTIANFLKDGATFDQALETGGVEGQAPQ